MVRFETGVRRLALVLAGAWVVYVIAKIAEAVKEYSAVDVLIPPWPMLAFLCIPAFIIMLSAELVLFVVRGFAGNR